MNRKHQMQACHMSECLDVWPKIIFTFCQGIVKKMSGNFVSAGVWQSLIVGRGVWQPLIVGRNFMYLPVLYLVNQSH